MKVMWVTNRPIAAAERKYDFKAISGTWMEPVLDEFSKRDNIEICIVTVHAIEHTDCFHENGIDYYCLPKGKGKIYDYKSETNISEWTSVIEKCNPDVIMIWGTEYAHGYCVARIADRMSIPCVIQLQGLMLSIAKYYYGGLSAKEINRCISFRNLLLRDGLRKQNKLFRKKAETELAMFRLVKNVIIENEWSANYIRSVCPDISVYYANANIRNVFFSKQWDITGCRKHTILCNMPVYPLKGFHMCIQAFSRIKQYYPDAVLYVPGIKNPFTADAYAKIKQDGYVKFWKRLIKKYNLIDSIEFLGHLTSDQMAETMLNTNAVVIPSAIEQSSITLREAMCIGVPCVSSYAGGASEIISHGSNGFLYRYEEPEQMAFSVMKIFENAELAIRLSENERNSVRDHLNVSQSVDAFMDIYHQLAAKQ